MRRVARTFVPLALFVLTALSSAAAWAEGAAPAAGNSQGLIAIGAALAIGLAALGGGLGQGRAAASALDGIARNPQASGQDLRTDDRGARPHRVLGHLRLAHRLQPVRQAVALRALFVRSRITTGLQALALAAAIAVFLGVVHRHYPIQRWLFWHYLRVAVLAGFWASACASAGCFLAARLRLARCARGADLVLAFPLGVLAFELAIFLLGLAGWLGPATFVLLPAVCLLVGAGHLLHLARAWPRRPPARNLVELALIGFGVLGVGILYFQILSPAPFSWDARWYHLPIAQQYAMQGAVRPFPEGWWPGAYPHGASLVYTWAFLLPLAGQFDKLELCAHLELAVFLATIASIPALVRLLVPGTSARLAWIAIFLFPGIFLYDGNLGAVPITWPPFGAFPWPWPSPAFGAAGPCATDSCSGPSPPPSCSPSIRPGVSSSFPAFAVSVRAAWLLLRKRGGSRRRVLAVFGATAGSALVLSAPHWLKNLIWYGDPLFPILHGWLKVHPWAAESPAMFRTFVSFTFPPAPGMKGITDALLSTLTFSFVPNDWWSYHHDVPVFGSLFTLTLLCLPWLRAPARLYLAYLGAMATLVAWYLMNHQDRLLQAWLPVMAGATGATLIMLWRERSLLVRGLVVVLVGAQLVWGRRCSLLPHPQHSVRLSPAYQRQLPRFRFPGHTRAAAALRGGRRDW